MTIKLSFPDTKASFIFELLQNFKFVIVEKQEDIPDWHKAILDNRIAEYEKNPNDLIDWEDVQKEKIKISL
jgi:Putative addiction module component